MIGTEQDSESEIAKLHPDQQASARNLLHYLVLRQDDLRPLQESLTQHGLSSLGRCEANGMRVADNIWPSID
jgi:pyruvate kinase